MFTIFKKLFSTKEPVKAPQNTTTPKVKRIKAPKIQPSPAFTPKEKATADGEPYVNVLGMDIDHNNISSGSFELDWNDKFLLNLIRSGYKKREDDTDNMIVDRWFQEICRSVVLETYEQSMADPDNRDVLPLTKPVTGIHERVISNKPLNNGRTEIS